MKAILFSLLLIASVMSSEITRDEGVLVLTDDNFQQAVSENKFLLVEFYAPWCGHCKKLAPEYAKAAATLAKEGLNIAKVDATVQKELGKKYEVSGYPTLKFFVDGVPSEYNGGRTDSEIVAWIRKKTGPPSKEFQTFADLSNFVDQQEVVVVFFGSNAELFHVYENTARVSEDVTFAHCSSEECLSKYDASNGQVVVFKKFDEKRNDLTTDFNESQLTHFINSNSSPKVMKFDEKCAQLIFGKNTPGIFFYRDANASDAGKYQELATALSEKLGVSLFFLII
jgi:protein disulfide-isomerase A1